MAGRTSGAMVRRTNLRRRASHLCVCASTVNNCLTLVPFLAQPACLLIIGRGGTGSALAARFFLGATAPSRRQSLRHRQSEYDMYMIRVRVAATKGRLSSSNEKAKPTSESAPPAAATTPCTHRRRRTRSARSPHRRIWLSTHSGRWQDAPPTPPAMPPATPHPRPGLPSAGPPPSPTRR